MNSWLFGPAAGATLPGVAGPPVRTSSIPLGVWASDKIPAEPPDTSSFFERLPDWKTVALLVALGYIFYRKAR